jgi:hypothetical protein
VLDTWNNTKDHEGINKIKTSKNSMFKIKSLRMKSPENKDCG